MQLSEKFAIILEVALVYDFLNSIDCRTYVEQGVPHTPKDELATPANLKEWMLSRGLILAKDAVSTTDYKHAIQLRGALRSYLKIAPLNRTVSASSIAELNSSCVAYPLRMDFNKAGSSTLQPVQKRNGIGLVVGEVFALAATGRLDRLKVCESPDCAWVFYDRSKPANRRWCSSDLCGNRHKTRLYRSRMRNR